MKLTNPTDQEISIKYEGRVYSCPANGFIVIPRDAAMYWKNMIHGFVVLSDATATKEQEVCEVKDEVESEELEKLEKPVKKVKK